MLYMVIEKFHEGKVPSLYRRLEERGRLMPDSLEYINSWIDADVQTCYQVMQTDSEQKLLEWIDNWKDLMDFEIVPVITSAEARKKVKKM